jgi:hypothetical protein
VPKNAGFYGSIFQTNDITLNNGGKMTKNCIKEVLKLQKNSEVFADLTVEQLLYACVSAVGLGETVAVLSSTPWKKYCPGEKYNGINKTTRMEGISLRNKKTAREVMWGDEFDWDEKVNMVLRYL